MQKKYFGTDGVRGRTNTPPMTAEIAMRLSMAAGACFHTGKSHRHSVVIGKDTRLSGYTIEPALTAGFTSVGMDVVLLGPLPTPGVAMITRSLRADLGVMISASHNGFQDNGLKFFGPDGYKLSDEMEQAIEARMTPSLGDALVGPETLGRARRIDDSQARYIEIVKGSFPRGMRLSGMRICVDCAHGAGYKVAPAALYELGAEVFPVGVSPNGCNINMEVGSTNPGTLQKAVQTYRADVGIALDGDGDRCIIVDEKGNIVDGDQLLGLIALHWLEDGRLEGKGVVSTIMSNMGLETCLKSKGLSLKRTRVGDRHVTTAMLEEGYNLGGEPSGHIVMSDYSTTGDGLIAALQILAIMVKQGKPLSQIAHIFDPVPQKHTNVAYTANDDPLNDVHVRKVITAAEKSLAGNGRLIIRKSGTEPLVRIMAESNNNRLCNKVVSDIAEALRANVPCAQQEGDVAHDNQIAGDAGAKKVAVPHTESAL